MHQQYFGPPRPSNSRSKSGQLAWSTFLKCSFGESAGIDGSRSTNLWQARHLGRIADRLRTASPPGNHYLFTILSMKPGATLLIKLS